MNRRSEYSFLARAWLSAIAASIIVTECLFTGTGMLLDWDLDAGYFIRGLGAALAIAVLAGGTITLLHKKSADRRRIAARIFDSHEALSTGGAYNAEACDPPPPQETSPAPTAPTPAPGAEAALAAMPPSEAQAKIRQKIRNLNMLPAMPVIAQKLLALKLDTEEGERALLTLIAQDPQIMARILGMSNSAMMGASRGITTVNEAALLLGTRRIQSVATGIAILSLMTKPPAGEFNVQDLWLHGFRVAFGMQGIARFMPQGVRPSDDHIFLAGMLHDIGYMVLAYIDPRLSDKLHNHFAAEPERPATEVEREVLEMGHDELGAELATHWNLPQDIVAVLRYHHTPDAPGAAPGQPLVRMIHLVEKLLPNYGIIEYSAPGIGEAEWQALGIDPGRAEEVRTCVLEQAERALEFVSTFA